MKVRYGTSKLAEVIIALQLEIRTGNTRKIHRSFHRPKNYVIYIYKATLVYKIIHPLKMVLN